MRKTIGFILALAIIVPGMAFATCTWTTNTEGKTGKVVCTTANESAFTSASSAALGWDINQCPKGVTFFACADSTKVFTGTGTFTVYTYHPEAALWGAYPDQNMTSSTTLRCQQFDGKWTVVTGGRIAVIPVGVGVDAGGATIYWSCN